MATLILDDVTINAFNHRHRHAGESRHLVALSRPAPELWAMTGPTGRNVQRVLELMRDGKSDRTIARRLGMERNEVRAIIHDVIEGANLDDAGRAEALAERVGIADS